MMSLSYLISFRPFFTKRHKIIITSKFKAKKMKEKFELLSQRSSPKTVSGFFSILFSYLIEFVIQKVPSISGRERPVSA
jgi:hypothetical protein